MVSTYTFLDQGSTHSFCDRKLIKTLKISGSPEVITLQTLNNPNRSCKGIACCLNVSSLDGSHNITIPKVCSISNIPVKPNLIPVKNVLDITPHLQDLEFPTIDHGTVMLLIGADVPELFCPLSVRKGKKGESIAIETLFGWCLLGPSLDPSTTSNCLVNFVQHQEE